VDGFRSSLRRAHLFFLFGDIVAGQFFLWHDDFLLNWNVFYQWHSPLFLPFDNFLLVRWRPWSVLCVLALRDVPLSNKLIKRPVAVRTLLLSHAFYRRLGVSRLPRSVRLLAGLIRWERRLWPLTFCLLANFRNLGSFPPNSFSSSVDQILSFIFGNYLSFMSLSHRCKWFFLMARLRWRFPIIFSATALWSRAKEVVKWLRSVFKSETRVFELERIALPLLT